MSEPDQVMFFPNGTTAVFDHHGNQMPQYQRPTHQESIEMLRKDGYDWRDLDVFGATIAQKSCSHIFRDTRHCVRCGWIPTAAELLAIRPPGRMSDDDFNRLVNGPLSHPLPMFRLTRLCMALRAVVDATGDAGKEALLDHCCERELGDRADAQES